MELTVGSRLKHAWNAFLNRAPTANYQYGIGGGYAYRPDRFRLTRGNERSIVTSVYNRIALDVAAINIQHVQLDDEGCYEVTAQVKDSEGNFTDITLNVYVDGTAEV